MNADYLWDGSGEPDADTARLEQLLAPFAWQGRIPERRQRWRWAAAAAVTAAIAAGTLARVNLRPTPAWMDAASGKPLYVGQLVETDAHSRATLQSSRVGQVRVDPGSSLRILAATGERRQLALRRGTIHALIWAPPRAFVVNTPSAMAIDLGCAYTLRVDPSGSGLVTVEAGWVAFQSGTAESFIPAGAACVTRPVWGPGIPYFQDAGGVFRTALSQFEESARPAALQTLLLESRPRDALTLWHLLSRAASAERGRIFDRLSRLVVLPPEVTREAAIAGDRKTLDLAWNALGLGSPEWWRQWERPWTGTRP